MSHWIESGEVDNPDGIAELRSIGINLPKQLGRLFLIGVDEETSLAVQQFMAAANTPLLQRDYTKNT